jgi:hypothetical protein
MNDAMGRGVQRIDCVDRPMDCDTDDGALRSNAKSADRKDS